jgi:hypothetical protein
MTDKRRIIKVYATEPFRLIPKEIHDEVTVTIGSKLSSDTKNVLMGLTEEEREIFLPPLTNVNPTSVNWEQSVNNFFAELYISIPRTGLELNVSTYKKEVNYRGTTKEIDYPYAVEDYIKWKQLLVDKTVAKNKSKLSEGVYIAYLIDEEEEKALKAKVRKNKDYITQSYLDLVKLSPEGKYVNEEKIKYVMFVLQYNPLAYDTDQMIEKIEIQKDLSIKELEDGIPLESTKLISILKDEKLKEKAFVFALLNCNAITRSGEYFVDANDAAIVLGRSIEEAINYISNGINNGIVAKWKHLHQSYVENLKRVNV